MKVAQRRCGSGFSRDGLRGAAVRRGAASRPEAAPTRNFHVPVRYRRCAIHPAGNLDAGATRLYFLVSLAPWREQLPDLA